MIIPVILEDKFDEIVTKAAIAEKFSNLIQIDFVDGKIFDGHTFLDIRDLNKINTRASLDIHLLVANPLDYLIKIRNVVKFCAQIEGFKDKEEIKKFISKSKDLGYKTGLSVGPETSTELLEEFVAGLDYVQFMTIMPGAQGRDFEHEVLKKIKDFRKSHPKMLIQTDGGIDKDVIPALLKAGVDDMVVGSAIFTSRNPEEKYLQLVSMSNSKTARTSDSIITLKRERVNKIAFLGGAAWHEDTQPYKDAYETAKAVAAEGFEVVNGGGPGVMRASTEGGHAAGGRVLAITYHPNKPKRHYEGVDPENNFDDEVITLDYFDRTKVMLQTTQAHIVFKGSIGTLSEFGMTWISSWIHEPDNKPIILYGDFWQDFLDVIHKHMLLESNEEKMLKICNSPEEVVNFLKKLKLE